LTQCQLNRAITTTTINSKLGMKYGRSMFTIRKDKEERECLESYDLYFYWCSFSSGEDPLSAGVEDPEVKYLVIYSVQ
jgi:hypothetical protein